MRGWYNVCVFVVVCFLFLWCLVMGGLYVDGFDVGLVFFKDALFCVGWFVVVV